MIAATLLAAAGGLVPGPATRTESLVVVETGPGRVRVGGRVLVNMASNDYLGFAHDTRVRTAAHQALDDWGLGSASTRVLSGTTILHHELEQRLAAWTGCQDAVRR